MKKHFINAYWWSANVDRPHNCLIEGDSSTRINLGFFKLENDEFILTEIGKLQFENWKNNNGII